MVTPLRPPRTIDEARTLTCPWMANGSGAGQSLGYVGAVRITFVVNNYPPRVGGVENHVASLARHLTEQGHEVVVQTLTRGATGCSDESGIRVYRWGELFTIGGLLGFPTPAAAWGIWRDVRESRSTVSVHTRFFPLTWLGAAAARSAHLPLILTEHGSDHVASPSHVIRWGSRIVDITLGRWSLRAADAVVGVSDDVVSFVRRLSGVGAQVFYNAIEAPNIPVEGSPRRHLVFVGRIVPGKGWEDFLEVVLAQEPSVTAEILGDGSDMERLQRRVMEIGLGSRVGLRGRVPLDDVFRSLAGAVLVNPTQLSEGFQTTLLEAVAVGGRVVTYPVPGAELLRSEGAPVRVARRAKSDLAEEVRRELDDPGRPWTAGQLAAWTWPVRAREYAGLAASVKHRQRKRRQSNL